MNERLKDICLKSIKSSVSTLKRKDRRISQLDYLLDKGVISIDYYREMTKKLNNEINSNEVKTIKIANEMGSWEKMTLSQKRLFVSKNVAAIIINVNTKQLVKVEFQDMN